MPDLNGTVDGEIERFIRSEIGLDSIFAPSFIKMLDKPSIPAALLVSKLSRIFIISLTQT